MVQPHYIKDVCQESRCPLCKCPIAVGELAWIDEDTATVGCCPDHVEQFDTAVSRGILEAKQARRCRGK